MALLRCHDNPGSFRAVARGANPKPYVARNESNNIPNQGHRPRNGGFVRSLLDDMRRNFSLAKGAEIPEGRRTGTGSITRLSLKQQHIWIVTEPAVPSLPSDFAQYLQHDKPLYIWLAPAKVVPSSLRTSATLVIGLS